MSKDYKEILKRAVEAPFGQAEAILKREGCWDEHADGGVEPKKYRVRVYGEMQVSAHVTVTARSEDEACDLAIDEASKDTFDWCDYGDVDITTAEVV